MNISNARTFAKSETIASLGDSRGITIVLASLMLLVLVLSAPGSLGDA